ncbi:MAG: hypothetical protein HQL33_12620 [Alphaproteobacteria bacterium]|nr:hypothetical protein [Alphaproteobacteria bacterium]
MSSDRVAPQAVAESESQRVAAPKFMSPVIRVDASAGLAVLVVRDGDSGDVRAQYPAKKVVEEYRTHGAPAQPQAQLPQETPASGQPVQAQDSAGTGEPSSAPSGGPETSVSA